MADAGLHVQGHGSHLEGMLQIHPVSNSGCTCLQAVAEGICLMIQKQWRLASLQGAHHLISEALKAVQGEAGDPVLSKHNAGGELDGAVCRFRIQKASRRTEGPTSYPARRASLSGHDTPHLLMSAHKELRQLLVFEGINAICCNRRICSSQVLKRLPVAVLVLKTPPQNQAPASFSSLQLLFEQQKETMTHTCYIAAEALIIQDCSLF